MGTSAADRALVKDEMGTEAAFLVSELMLRSSEQTQGIEHGLMKSLEKENEDLKKTIIKLKRILWKIENHFMSLFLDDDDSL